MCWKRRKATRRSAAWAKPTTSPSSISSSRPTTRRTSAGKSSAATAAWWSERRMRRLALLAALCGCVHFQEGPVDWGKPPSEFVQVHDRKMHLIDRGKGPRTVLLIHGYGASKTSFEELIDRLAPEMRVL